MASSSAIVLGMGVQFLFFNFFVVAPRFERFDSENKTKRKMLFMLPYASLVRVFLNSPVRQNITNSWLVFYFAFFILYVHTHCAHFYISSFVTHLGDINGSDVTNFSCRKHQRDTLKPFSKMWKQIAIDSAIAEAFTGIHLFVPTRLER